MNQVNSISVMPQQEFADAIPLMYAPLKDVCDKNYSADAGACMATEKRKE
jgi:hypothetical protein